MAGDHDALDTALQKAGTRVGASIGPVQTGASLQADLAAGIMQSCEELSRSNSTGSKRGIIVLFQSEDPALKPQMEAIEAAVSGAGAHLYAIQIERYAGVRQTPGPPPVWTPNFSNVTAQLISGIAKTSGGKIVRRNWDVKPILNELRK